MNISPAQQAALDERGLRQFVADLRERAAAQWPVEFAPPRTEVAHRAVEEAVDDARGLGFRTELDVSRFVHLVFAFRTRRFHEQDWAAEIMQAPAELPARIRMNRLFDAGCAELEARERPASELSGDTA